LAQTDQENENRCLIAIYHGRQCFVWLATEGCAGIE